jgi:hypothetical protein
MSSEPPPNPITTNFNLSAWIQAVGSGLSIALANTLYLSKTVASTAAGLITFSAGIKTNTIVAASGNDITIGELGGVKAVYLYTPTLSNAILDLTDSTFKIPSTQWVTLWFGNLLTTTGLSWTMAQIFNGGVKTDSLVPLTSSGTLSIAPSSTAITIGTSQANTNTVGIGASGSIISIPGATTCGVVSSNNFNTATAASDVNICLASTGSVKLAVASNRSGVLNLGDGASSTGAVHLNNGASATGNTRIMNGTDQSGELTLGTAGGTNSVVIALNRPLTAGYTYATESGTVGAGSTGVGKIGQIIRSPFSALTAPSGVKSVMGEVIITAGVWILTGNFNISVPPGTATFAQTSWWLGSVQYGITDYSSFSINPRSFSGTTVIYSSAGGTYQLKIEMYYSGASQATAQNTGWNISALRIG